MNRNPRISRALTDALVRGGTLHPESFATSFRSKDRWHRLSG